MNPLRSLITRILPKAWFSAYEAANPSPRRGRVRLVVAKADRRFSYRQLILIERFIKPVWLFVIGDAIVTKRLPEQESWTRVAFTTGRKSSGLGLCFVLEAAALRGGTIRVENRPDGRGARAILQIHIRNGLSTARHIPYANPPTSRVKRVEVIRPQTVTS
jgi:hypothetical protein